MYADPAKIRKPKLRLRLSDYEAALLEAYVERDGGEMAAIVREIVMERVLTSVGQEFKHIAKKVEAPVWAQR